MNKNIILAGVVVFLLVGAGFYLVSDREEAIEEIMMETHEDGEMSFGYRGELVDVTDGAGVRGINTGGNASGVVLVGYSDMYELEATFENLPTPVGTDFYEGWVVRRGENMSVISTGALTLEDGVYVNRFSSTDDLIDHDFYVLTLEPDDGDPAPADHIVEGEIMSVE